MEHNFKNLIVWQKADELAFQIYKLTQKFPNSELYGLTSQMRRASISVAANITEGYTRNSVKEKLKFYNIADASLAELEYFIHFVNRLDFIKGTNYQDLVNLKQETGKLLNGLMRSIKDVHEV